MVEFVNRLVTGLVSVAVILAVLGSLARRPRRPDLVWLSLGLVAGVIGQIVLGGLVVLFHLYPPLVMGHFVVSMLLLLDAAVLHHRAGDGDAGADGAEPGGAVPPPPAWPARRALGRLLLGSAAVAILFGTAVTGSGPHAGSHDGQLVQRLPFAIGEAARVHGVAVFVFAAIAVFTVRSLRVAGAPRRVQTRAEVLLTVLVAQAAVGYTQYFTGVPALLVAVHVAGSVVVWVACVRLVLVMNPAARPGTADQSHGGLGAVLTGEPVKAR
jgi:cytochrome c oxidase assembly protein subunit 15